MPNILVKRVSEDDDLEEVVISNLKIADLLRNLPMFCCAEQAYFRVFPRKNFQDLELFLRNNNFDTHIIAWIPNHSFPYRLGMINDVENANTTNTNENTNESNTNTNENKYRYECITSCRPKENALAEVLHFWSSYEDNFNALKHTGVIILKDIGDIDNNNNSNNNTNTNENYNDENDLNHLIATNKVKLSVVSL